MIQKNENENYYWTCWCELTQEGKEWKNGLTKNHTPFMSWIGDKHKQFKKNNGLDTNVPTPTSMLDDFEKWLGETEFNQ